MLYDGIILLDDSTVENLIISSGANLPTGTQNKGELFFKDGVGLHVYNGTAWEQLVISVNTETGNVTLSAADVGAVPASGGTMTGALTLSADPTNALHAATKQYVDAVVQGLDPKASVRVATTGNITLSGTQTIDGVAVVAGDRVLVKNQTAGETNGIYIVASGAWSRAPDADNVPGAEVTTGMYTFVEDGTTQGSTGWNLVTKNITLGTTPLVFTQFGAATNYTAGTNVNISGNVISVPNSNLPYDIAGSILGKPAASAVVARFVAVRSFTIPAGMTGSIAKSGLSASATTILSVQKNGSQFGTITWAASGTTGTFAAASQTSFSAGDVFTVVAPASQDATFGDAEFTIVASLS